MLLQPVSIRLSQKRRILLAGCGGGYDVLGAVPLLTELLADGREVFLASHSFCNLSDLPGATRDSEIECLYQVPAAAAVPDRYCPEAWLARWCVERLGKQIPMWAFAKKGAQPLHAAYQRLVSLHGVDAIVLIDGGIDAILRGNESSLGTPAEDLASLAAVSRLEVPTKLVACVGLGAEMRDGICHEQALGRIAELTSLGANLGSATLLAQMAAGERYLEAVDYVFANQEGQRTSHIHNVVSAAVRGEFGSRGEHVWISPLLNQLWFFDLMGVASSHLFLEHLWDTQESWDVSARIEGLRKSLHVLPRSRIPM
jgi:hypothetical protein